MDLIHWVITAGLIVWGVILIVAVAGQDAR